jgi:hypothetical protein
MSVVILVWDLIDVNPVGWVRKLVESGQGLQERMIPFCPCLEVRTDGFENGNAGKGIFPGKAPFRAV